MKKSSLIPVFGIASLIGAWVYAGGVSFATVSAVFFVPAFALAIVLQSRVRRKKVEEKTGARCAISVGGWFLVSSIAGALMVTRPGREGAGMFGGLILVWPLGVGLVTCFIIAAFLPAKRLTCNR